MEELQAEGAKRPEDGESLRNGHTSLGKGALNFQRLRDWEVQSHWTWIPTARCVQLTLELPYIFRES